MQQTLHSGSRNVQRPRLGKELLLRTQALQQKNGAVDELVESLAVEAIRKLQSLLKAEMLRTL